MDFDIVKSILENSGQGISRIDLDDHETEIKDDKLQSRNPELTSALANSLATLLSQRISTAAHQRYLVRTNLIEQLRDWSRVTSRYSQLHTFTDGERTTKLSMNLVKKHLTEEFIRKQYSVNVLVKLGFALIDMKLRNPTFEYKLDNIINRILYLDRTADSDLFLDTLTAQYEELSLALPTIENIYICKTEILVESPIVDFFIFFNGNHSELQTIKNHINSSAEIGSHSISQLLEYSSRSPRIFQLLSSILKEMLKHSNCSNELVNFIQFVVNDISNRCEEKKNKIIDLYPRNIQCTVILLKIEPKFHTNNSKDYVTKKLKSIYNLNKHEILILLTHFPLWIEEFSNVISSDPLLR